MDIVLLFCVFTIIPGAFSAHLTRNAAPTDRRSLRQSTGTSFARRVASSNSRVPVITSAELRAIYRAREIRRQQKLLEQQRRLAHMSKVQQNAATQQNLLSQLITQQQQQAPLQQHSQQQQIPISNDMLRNLLLAAFLGNEMNTANTAQVQSPKQSPTATTGGKASATKTQKANSNPVVIETNGSIQLSEVKKANGQTHIVIDASSMGLNPLTATLKPGEDPPEPEIKLPFGHRK